MLFAVRRLSLTTARLVELAGVEALPGPYSQETIKRNIQGEVVLGLRRSEICEVDAELFALNGLDVADRLVLLLLFRIDGYWRAVYFDPHREVPNEG